MLERVYRCRVRHHFEGHQKFESLWVKNEGGSLPCIKHFEKKKKHLLSYFVGMENMLHSANPCQSKFMGLNQLQMGKVFSQNVLHTKFYNKLKQRDVLLVQKFNN
jgi:hypothetical protein